jgi:hypothetical protein
VNPLVPRRERRERWQALRASARAIRARSIGRPMLRTFMFGKLDALGPRGVGPVLEMFPVDSTATRDPITEPMVRHLKCLPRHERRLWKTEERHLRRHIRLHRSHHGDVRRLQKVRLHAGPRRWRSTSRASRSTSARRRNRRRSRRSASDDGPDLHEVLDLARVHHDEVRLSGEPS